MATAIQQKADQVRRLLGEIESDEARQRKDAGTALRVANDARLDVQERYDIACEIIANHLDGGNTDRARDMVEEIYELRHPRTQAVAS